jgi:D-3-phosphoglycerate dehydrogenase / 2-oxoglutarate reductase
MMTRQRVEIRQDRPVESAETMSETVDNLILDLLEWIGPGQRPYTETMEAWRTSCPRLPIWEDATDLGLIVRHRDPGRTAVVTVSALGAEDLRAHRPPSRP